MIDPAQLLQSVGLTNSAQDRCCTLRIDCSLMPLPGWNLLPHLRCRKTRNRSGPPTGTGATSPNLRTSVRHPNHASLPVTFCSRIAGMRASSTRSVLPTRQSRYRRAAAARTCGGSNPADSSSSPSKRGRRSVSHRAPGPTRSERPRPLMGRRRSARTPDHRGQRRSPHSATRFAVPRGVTTTAAQRSQLSTQINPTRGSPATAGLTLAHCASQSRRGVAAIGGPWWAANQPPITALCGGS